jgi:hypothetical protein
MVQVALLGAQQKMLISINAQHGFHKTVAHNTTAVEENDVSA